MGLGTFSGLAWDRCEGLDIEITSSVFGVFKPSLFHAALTVTTVAALTADKDLMLLDAQCLPGSE
eukprot:6375001-Amphidinium_carterae.1